MSRGVVVVGLLIVVSVILHGALMPYVTIFGGRVNLLVAVVAGGALHYGTTAGMAIGLTTGLLADILLGSVMGLVSVPLVIIGFMVGQVERQLFRDAFLVPVVVSLVSTATFEICVLFLSRLAFGVWWRRAFVASFIPTVLINGAFMPLIFLWIGRVLPRRKEEVI